MDYLGVLSRGNYCAPGSSPAKRAILSVSFGLLVVAPLGSLHPGPWKLKITNFFKITVG